MQRVLTFEQRDGLCGRHAHALKLVDKGVLLLGTGREGLIVKEGQNTLLAHQHLDNLVTLLVRKISLILELLLSFNSSRDYMIIMQ